MCDSFRSDESSSFSTSFIKCVVFTPLPQVSGRIELLQTCPTPPHYCVLIPSYTWTCNHPVVVLIGLCVPYICFWIMLKISLFSLKVVSYFVSKISEPFISYHTVWVLQKDHRTCRFLHPCPLFLWWIIVSLVIPIKRDLAWLQFLSERCEWM